MPPKRTDRSRLSSKVRRKRKLQAQEQVMEQRVSFADVLFERRLLPASSMTPDSGGVSTGNALSLTINSNPIRNVNRFDQASIIAPGASLLLNQQNSSPMWCRTNQASTTEKNPAPTDPASREFERSFLNIEYGVPCTVCDRLWFRNDLKVATSIHSATMERIGCPTASALLCSTCAASLEKSKVPNMASYNGFRYPPFPEELKGIELNAISKRLVSPRVPFMQIRRIRHDSGAYRIHGQIINVPIDVQETVRHLPRNLNDDIAFNVSLKKHIIHKSSAYSGIVKKKELKAWLKYLENTPLYKLYKITVNWSQYNDSRNGEEACEPDIANSNDDYEMLIADQESLLWSEEKYLCIAPGQNSTPLSIIYDEFAEELSFPAIYFGVPRTFREGVKVTPFQVVTSEIRRRDRRGTTPEHVLYMAAKIMRLRVSRSLHSTFRFSGDLSKITREMIEDKRFVEQCVTDNFAFLRSIPNSCQYWLSKKKELFAMIRQLGKPTFFLTMSANELRWPHLLNILNKIRKQIDEDELDPLKNFRASYRASLVNEDSVTCCIYFWKMMNTIMRILKSSKISPFAPHHIVDYFIRTEFQHRGSPHLHVLVWLNGCTPETLSEEMPMTIKLINRLCSVDIKHDLKDQEYAKLQIHHHTFTCYKNKTRDGQQTSLCRFKIPYWPIRETRILLPMAKDDGRRKAYSKKGLIMKRSLENNAFDHLNDFLNHSGVDYKGYLNIIRASITRPTVVFKRDMSEIWINTFNPWIGNQLKSNMDFQYILEEYSCAAYVVDYINKSNRGMSNLQRQLRDLQEEYPDQDYTDLLKRVSLRMLDAVEMTTQEAAWYLLRQSMSEASREGAYIPTCVPNERMRVHKQRKEMMTQNLSPDSTDIWCFNIVEKYENRPSEFALMNLADFASKMTPIRGKRDSAGCQKYRERQQHRILRWTSYDVSDETNYKRSMVLLFYPFRNEQIDLLDNDKFLEIYNANELAIIKSRQNYEKFADLEKAIMEHHELWDMLPEEDNETSSHLRYERYVHQPDLLAEHRNEDIREIPIPLALSAVIKTRSNVLTSAEYCQRMRCTNFEQRALIKHCIARIHDSNISPIQILFSGPAGCGKTYTLLLMMETYNRFAQTHDSQRNVYVATGSTGKAAVAIGGTTVHSAFSIPLTQRRGGFKFETLQMYRNAFSNIRVIIIDEISMIGAGVFHTINDRMKNITMEFDLPFGGTDMVFCGDLRQLPPVRATPIYEPVQRGLHRSVLWQSLSYYPLQEVMRQEDVSFSNVLTKIGNGEELQPEEQCMIESRFRTRNWCNENVKDAVRLFHKNLDVDKYNRTIAVECYSVANDTYSGHDDQHQLASARNRVHKLCMSQTGNLLYSLPLGLNQPYMITANLNLEDGIVNGAMGLLRHVDFSLDEEMTQRNLTTQNTCTQTPHCLWIEFYDNIRIGRQTRSKCRSTVLTRCELNKSWTPIYKRASTFEVSKKIRCRRVNFPASLATAMSTHKAQGGTFDKIVFDYSRSLSQQLVYVALSRVKSIGGLYITNADNNFTFHHAKPMRTPGLIRLQTELARLEEHKLATLDHQALRKLQNSRCSILLQNVQSLAAHVDDITTDHVLMQATFFCFTETWVQNETPFEIDKFHLLCQNKRSKRTGGVAIYKKKDATLAASLPQVQPILNNDGIGDLCFIDDYADGVKLRIVVIYINPGASFPQLSDFLLTHHQFLEPHPDKTNNSKLLVCGDFNFNMMDDSNRNILTNFMESRFCLKMINNPLISTTNQRTCIDLIFARNLENKECFPNISYFSYHKPIFVILDSPMMTQ